MPITAVNGGSIANIKPLSRSWTYWKVASQAMVLTGEQDNQNVVPDYVRYHINTSLSHLVDLLNVASQPFYGIEISAGIESSADSSGLDYIDLTSGINVANFIHSIKRVSFPKGSVNTQWNGNAAYYDLSALLTQRSDINTQNRHSVWFNHFGNYIYLFIGNNIASSVNTSGTTYTLGNPSIFAYRQPLLDDMVDEVNSVTFKITQTPADSEFIDLPDRYVKLLVDMVCVAIIQQRKEPVPGELQQSVNQGLALLSKNLQDAVALAQKEQQERRFGQPQRSPQG